MQDTPFNKLTVAEQHILTVDNAHRYKLIYRKFGGVCI